MKANDCSSRGIGERSLAPRSNSGPTILAFILLAAAVLGCASANPGIDRILNATSKHDAGEALRDHGPLRVEELQYVYDATHSSNENKRRNAARLLITTVKGN